ncbi:hypothetical protein HDV00_005799 [Rhizophlyctis rosea]|nr:hypothetical protein HDV00_005799 [Rhizophlyctis rosea]
MSTTSTTNNSILKKCAACGNLTTLRCSRCKFINVCSKDCMKRIWKVHKPECQMLSASPPPESEGLGVINIPLNLYPNIPPPTGAFVLEGEDLETWRHLTYDQAWLQRRNGLPDEGLPSKEYYGCLSVEKRVEMFADQLELWDSSSPVYASRSRSLQMGMNRKFNVCYQTFVDNFPVSEQRMLKKLLRERRIGAANNARYDPSADGDPTTSTVASEASKINKRSHDQIDEESEEALNRHGTDNPAGGGSSSTSSSSASRPPKRVKPSKRGEKNTLSPTEDWDSTTDNMHTKSGSIVGEEGTNGFSHDGISGASADGKGSHKLRSVRDQELVRLMVQALADMDLRESADLLQRESGYKLESPTTSKFRQGVLQGDWDSVEKLISTMDISPKNLKYLIKQQKYLEVLQARDVKAALIILRQELAPLSTSQDRLHELTSYLMCSSVEDLKRAATWDGVEDTSREQLLMQLQKYISSAVMIPEHRLNTLVDQALSYQKLGCLYHNVEDASLSLFTDHACDRNHFPSTTTHVLEEHSDEVWFISFSNNGLYLASASKDATAIIWSIEEYRSKYTLSGHSQAISYLAWSPDDSMLLTGSNDQSVKLWNTASGTLENNFSRHTDTVNSLAWLPSGEHFISGSVDKYIYLWNLDGDILHKWSGVRVMDLTITGDGKHLVVISEKRIGMYDIVTKEEVA